MAGPVLNTKRIGSVRALPKRSLIPAATSAW
jgi:hypothetical protein